MERKRERERVKEENGSTYYALVNEDVCVPSTPLFALTLNLSLTCNNLFSLSRTLVHN